MADFFNNITSISWWIGVVITTILLNLVAMYLKSPFDRCLSSISTKYQTRSKAKKAERETKIANLVGNKHEQILFASDMNFTLAVAGFMTISGFSFVIISIGLLIVHYHTPTLRGLAVFLLLFVPLGGLIITIGFIPFSKAIDDWQILREAKDRESKIEPK